MPGVLLLSEEFAPAAAAQSRSLGFAPALRFVSHPIQNRTHDELVAMADDAVADIVALLTSDPQDP